MDALRVQHKKVGRLPVILLLHRSGPRPRNKRQRRDEFWPWKTNINWSKQLRMGRNTLLWLNVLTRLYHSLLSRPSWRRRMTLLVPLKDECTRTNERWWNSRLSQIWTKRSLNGSARFEPWISQLADHSCKKKPSILQNSWGMRTSRQVMAFKIS